MRAPEYLRGEAAFARHAIAARWVRDCPEILEIGGGATPITDHLNHAPRRVVVVDPAVVPRRASELAGRPCEVEHVAARFQDVELDVREYGLIMLGFGLRYFRVAGDPPRPGASAARGLLSRVPKRVRDVVTDATDNLPWSSNRDAFRRLVTLIDAARVTVIGIPSGWWLSELQLAHLLREARAKIDLRVEVDLLDRRIPRRFRRRRLLRLR